MSNKNLQIAKKTKNDDFFTRLSDIEDELQHYRKHFRGKTLYCNCDDPLHSNFTFYFLMHFNELKLKRLISMGFTVLPAEKASGRYKALCLDVSGIKEDMTAEAARKFLLKQKASLTYSLKENGDFRSDESIELLKQADIVVTNPPFSLFKEYMGQIMQYKKKFLVIGHINALQYLDIFSQIKDNKMWLGVTSGSKIFMKPDGTTQNLGNTYWFTNLVHDNRHKPLQLMTIKDNLKHSRHSVLREHGYLKYANYNAIDVPFIDAIPSDTDDIMGVPITFLSKYCPEQFEILGNSNDTRWLRESGVNTMGQKVIDELRAQGNKSHVTTNMRTLYLYDKDGKIRRPYGRIIIRRKL